jgi:hypothetical protein
MYPSAFPQHGFLFLAVASYFDDLDANTPESERLNKAEGA